MTDYLNEKTIALAFIGDAVYELFIREHVFDKVKMSHADQMHRASVKFVKASAQCESIKQLLRDELLSEEEIALVKRARNHKVATKAKNASMVEYKWATAFEALIGYLYLSKQTDRMNEIMKLTLSIPHSDDAHNNKKVIKEKQSIMICKEDTNE